MTNLPRRNPLTQARVKRSSEAKLKVSDLLDDLDLDLAEEILVLTELINSRLSAAVIEQERVQNQSDQ